MKPVYLVAYKHYGEDSYFNTFDKYRALDYAAQHNGKIYECVQWLELGDSNKLSQPLSTTEKEACSQLAVIPT